MDKNVWINQMITEVIQEEFKTVEMIQENNQLYNYLAGKVFQKTKGKGDPKAIFALLKLYINPEKL